MAGVRGRPPGLPKSPNSGKKAGMKNVKPMETAVMRESIRLDCLAVYQRLGGQDWLYAFCKDHPAIFVSQILPRIAPAFAKPEETLAPSVNVNVNNLPMLEQAKLVAFLLNSAVQGQEPPARTIDHQPAKPEPVEPYAPEAAAPIDVSTDSLQEQARQAAARELVANTIEQTIDTYAGSSREQGGKRRNLI